MDAYCMTPDELPDLNIQTLGPCTFESPLVGRNVHFTADDERIAVFSHSYTVRELAQKGGPAPSFEMGGPRGRIYFNPSELKCGIVTCGGLCPGLNDVIRTVTLGLLWQYQVKKVYGFRYGYAGLTAKAPAKPIELTPEAVDEIHLRGGDILGSSRGNQDCDEMAQTLEDMGIGLLFIIGGDGTLRGARELAQTINRRGSTIGIIGIPKTIDNDICGIEESFGFSTAVEAARNAILGAHNEAKGAYNGVGLVKLMGRDSGFIAAHATLANSDVNFCFIPEEPLLIDGEGGFLQSLEKRLQAKHHAVVVVAEGVGEAEHGKDGAVTRDASGNILREDIGPMLKRRITEYFTARGIKIAIKYIDPSYMIRSLPADSNDSAFCLMLGLNAVHAGMAGRTSMVISCWNHYFVHVPMELTASNRKKVDPQGDLWQTVLETTGQLQWS